MNFLKLARLLPALLSLSLFAEVGTFSETVAPTEKDPIKRMTARYRDSDLRFLGSPRR